jgi:hypothetical protein
MLGKWATDWPVWATNWSCVFENPASTVRKPGQGQSAQRQYPASLQPAFDDADLCRIAVSRLNEGC